MTQTKRAIIRISTGGKHDSRINYSRRMYAIIRRYTPDVTEGNINECFADLTGLRTFFKMTYAEIAENIKKDLIKDIGVKFILSITSVEAFNKAKNNFKTSSRKAESFSTYKEINKLFAGTPIKSTQERGVAVVKKRRFAVPFIGAVS